MRSQAACFGHDLVESVNCACVDLPGGAHDRAVTHLFHPVPGMFRRISAIAALFDVAGHGIALPRTPLGTE